MSAPWTGLDQIDEAEREGAGISKEEVECYFGFNDCRAASWQCSTCMEWFCINHPMFPDGRCAPCDSDLRWYLENLDD